MLTTRPITERIISAHAATPGATPLAFVARLGPAEWLWVGAAGNVTLTLEDGNISLPLNGVIPGRWHRMPPFTHITAATATNLVVGY